MSSSQSLDASRAEYAQQKFLAMPIAGAIAWTVAGILGTMLPTRTASLALFFCTGMIFGLGILVGKLIGEPLIDREKPLSELDRLFLTTVMMANLVWAIAIPFYMIDHTSLPLTVGVLAGTMWLPFSWMIQHWVGYFHAVSRTVLIVIAWYAYPAQRFVVIPAIIVAIYLISIYALATRQRPSLAAQAA
jgi:hypothetical protein